MIKRRVEQALLLFLASSVTAKASVWADVFPGPPASTSIGSYQGIYMAIRGVNDAPLSQSRIDQIRASEDLSRRFYSANSGGAYDLRYTHILDVALPLNPDGTRIGDWWGDAENYVRNEYGIEPEDFHVNLFDVSGTTPDPGQGWSGVAIIPSNNFAIQADIATSWGQFVSDHEHGHRVGAPHASAWRTLNDGSYTPYVWESGTREYVEYDPTVHGHQSVTYGIHLDEYGNPFDTMGNISNGHFTVHEKLTDLDWLNNAKVPNLSVLGEGAYRLYAHDELATTIDPFNGRYGVEETYDSSALYGLTYDRQAERFNPSTGSFEQYTQTITLEYRSGSDGVQFHLDDGILDLDPEGGVDRNNTERALEVGQLIEDIDFGVSIYQATGEEDDFLSYNPPPPTNRWELATEWYEFSVLSAATDSLGSYIEIDVDLIELSMAGDLNRDGVINSGDLANFRDHWLSDTSAFDSAEQFVRGDLDLSGTVDLNDAWLLADIFADAGQAFLMPGLGIPEPTTTSLGMITIMSTLACQRKILRA